MLIVMPSRKRVAAVEDVREPREILGIVVQARVDGCLNWEIVKAAIVRFRQRLAMSVVEFLEVLLIERPRVAWIPENPAISTSSVDGSDPCAASSVGSPVMSPSGAGTGNRGTD